MPLMAYSPIEQGRLLRTRALVEFARQQAMTPAQVALAWLLAQDGVIAIPKAGKRERVRGERRRPRAPADAGAAARARPAVPAAQGTESAGDDLRRRCA